MSSISECEEKLWNLPSHPHFPDTQPTGPELEPEPSQASAGLTIMYLLRILSQELGPSHQIQLFFSDQRWERLGESPQDEGTTQYEVSGLELLYKYSICETQQWVLWIHVLLSDTL